MAARRWFCIFSIAAILAGGTAVRAKIAEDTKGSLENLASIGDALDSANGHPVHILYIHGINQVGAGDSSMLRDSICTRLKLCEKSDWKFGGTEFADKGEFADGTAPPALEYMGEPIWAGAQEWHDAAPFVAHWYVHLKKHRALLVVDEINWWPLTLALKCRRIVTSEAYLAGPNKGLLGVCSQQSMQDPGGEGRFYAWIPPDEANRLAKVRPHAAQINRGLKNGLEDWGFSDAMLGVGPLGAVLQDGLRQLMVKSAAYNPGTAAAGSKARYDWEGQLQRGNGMDQEFVGVTHSMGSYLLFETLNLGATGGEQTMITPSAETSEKLAEDNAVRYIFERMSLIYFFANQIPILELANLGVTPGTAAGSRVSGAPTNISPEAHLGALVNRWAQYQSDFQRGVHPADEATRKKIQIVAWSDPSDLLTWRVPKIGGVDVANLYVQNAIHWFWLFESPEAAHDHYAENRDVLRTMFRITEPKPGQ